MSPTTVAPGRRSLLIDGTLSLSGPAGERITVRGLGERMTVDIERISLGGVLRAARPSRAARRRWLDAGQAVLGVAEVGVELSLGGYPIGRYDRATKGTIVARLLGLGPMDLSLRRLLTALLATSAGRASGRAG